MKNKDKTPKDIFMERVSEAYDYMVWFSKFYPQNKEFFIEYVLSEPKSEDETEQQRFDRALSKFPDLENAFWRWTK